MADDVAGAVRRTPRPTPRADDHQTPETGAPVAPGVTNPASPVSPDTGNVSGELSPEAAEALAALRAKLAETFEGIPGSVVFGHLHTTDDDTQAFVELPDCAACEGTGKDQHGSPFEQPLAVHFAGEPVTIGDRRRQLCMWCGHVLLDVLRTRVWEAWPVGALVCVEDGLGTVVPHEPGAELPPGCCALPDDEPADDGRCSRCSAPRTAFDPFGDGLCKQHLAEAYTAEADAERQADEADGRAEQQLTDDDHRDLDDEPRPSEEDR